MYATATKLATARTFSLSGQIASTSSFLFDGTQSVDEIHMQIISRVGELNSLKRNVHTDKKTRFPK